MGLGIMEGYCKLSVRRFSFLHTHAATQSHYSLRPKSDVYRCTVLPHDFHGLSLFNGFYFGTTVCYFSFLCSRRQH